jgi:ubiquinone/menaquinone biosynthesis C-methylase UbiE
VTPDDDAVDVSAALTDVGHVREQYASEENLAKRRSVWVDDGVRPVEPALEAIRRARPARVLDIGCGQGWLAKRIAAEIDAAVVAADASPRMAELAAAPGVEAVVADAQALPFTDGEFDCVVAAWMLYHVADLDRAFSEFARVLRPGGLFVAITNGAGHLRELWALVHRRPYSLNFNRENGAALLADYFLNVERHDLTTRARFSDREAVLRYLSSVAEAEELIQRVPAAVAPFDAHGEPTLFLARR